MRWFRSRRHSREILVRSPIPPLAVCVLRGGVAVRLLAVRLLAVRLLGPACGQALLNVDELQGPVDLGPGQAVAGPGRGEEEGRPEDVSREERRVGG